MLSLLPVHARCDKCMKRYWLYIYYQMLDYPLTKIDRDDWNKKVELALMHTIPSEDVAIPALKEFEEILTRLLSLPLEETLAQDTVEYFFVGVFPPVCQKIIKSRYLKNQITLGISNNIISMTVTLVGKYPDIAARLPGFSEVLVHCLSTEEAYFKSNAQVENKVYNYQYLTSQVNEFEKDLKPGDSIDAIKYTSPNDKVGWMQGKVEQIDEKQIIIKFNKHTIVQEFERNTLLVAPFQSKTKENFVWRNSLKEGSVIDAEDTFGNWYNATVLKLQDKGNGVVKVLVTFKVYHQNGPKEDQKGHFYGFSDYTQTFPLVSPKIQPFCSLAKEYCYESSKSPSDIVNDINDHEFREVYGEIQYAFPRKKHLSKTLVAAINSFGRIGGFTSVIKKLNEQYCADLLAHYLKGLSGVCPYLHRQTLMESVVQLKQVVQNYFLGDSDSLSKNYSKERSELIFSSLRGLQRRMYLMEKIYDYENQIKTRVVEQCFKSEALKKKLQGMNELKEILKSMNYGSSRDSQIVSWIKDNSIFEKVYIINSHVQLIKKSESFFRFMINENLLTLEELEKLLKMAHGDYETRISIYSLFNQVSHIFKKTQVQFLIDRILESQIESILIQDIDLLHQLSKYHSYFPMEKAMKYFESIILSEGKNQQLQDYSIKKYGDLVGKNHQIKPYRKEIIHNLLTKMTAGNVQKIVKILTIIFGEVGYGDYGKRELTDILSEEHIDDFILNTIREQKDSPKWKSIVSQSLKLLLSVYKITSRFAISVKIIHTIWELIGDNEEVSAEFFKWLNEVLKCQQGIEYKEYQNLKSLFTAMFTPTAIQQIDQLQFEVAKSLFISINKKSRTLSVTNRMKEKDVIKEYKRKTSIFGVEFYDSLMLLLFESKSSKVKSLALEFFTELYCGTEDSQEDIKKFTEFLFKNLLALSKDVSKGSKQEVEKSLEKVNTTLKLLEITINDSEKKIAVKIDSLISRKKNKELKFSLINQCNYLSESIKKLPMSISANSTLFEFRQKIAKQVSLNWQQVRIVGKDQLLDLYNCKTLRELKLNTLDTYTVSRRVPVFGESEELIKDGNLSPKAVAIFKRIFEQYSTDGKMSKEQCQVYTAKCLKSMSPPSHYKERVDEFYSNNDDDRDGFLVLQNLLKFYKESALARESTVWDNLKSFGVMSNLKFKDDPLDEVQCINLPRKILQSNPEIYQCLFALLKHKEVAGEAFSLLQRLPVAQEAEAKILDLGEDGANLSTVLTIVDPYEFYYNLNVIEYLATSEDLKTQEEKDWLSKFIYYGGSEILLRILQKIIQKLDQNEEDIYKDITELILGLLDDHFLNCLSTKQSQQAYSLFKADIEFEHKVQYLVTGSFPEKDQAIKVIEPTVVVTDFEDVPLSEIWSIFVELLNTVWKQKNNTYLKSSLIDKTLNILCITLVDEKCQAFVNSIGLYLSSGSAEAELKKLYHLILCVCHYSTDNQKMFIKQLFNYLTAQNNISLHFHALAYLVMRYGIEQVNREELGEVLFRNILETDNQLTIEGCSHLLCYFDLKDVSEEYIRRIWDECLFTTSPKCHKPSAWSSIFNLLHKIAQTSEKSSKIIMQMVMNTISLCMNSMKITYCNEVNHRSANGFAGLKNLGNICYINSMMQQLYSNKPFRYLMNRIDDGKEEDLQEHKEKLVDDNLLHQFQKIFGYLEHTQRLDFVPFGFCFAYKPFGESVNVMVQQDVQEFVSMFFDQMEQATKHTAFRRIIPNFYQGKTVNLFCCQDCKQVNKVTDPFYHLSVQVKNSKTISESFNRFASGELISDYTCNFCEKKVEVSKKTRILEAPSILTIHLQRIVFNLDTLVNEKITTRHQFSQDLNIYPYTLEQFEKPDDLTQQALAQIKQKYDYHLTGIVCHIGNSESGHYISYIKTGENKWFQFNDSQVYTFNPTNIETECFGGQKQADNYSGSNHFLDEYEWQQKIQASSKSAYVLLYQKNKHNPIELVFKSQQEKMATLEELDLHEVKKRLKSHVEGTDLVAEKAPEVEETDSRSDEGSKPNQNVESQTDEKMEIQELILKKQKSGGDKELIVEIDRNVSAFLGPRLKEKIEKDNRIHFLEKSLASDSFSLFFSKMMILPSNYSAETFDLQKKMTFGFWLKSPHFKDLMASLNNVVLRNPQTIFTILEEKDRLIALLIENFDPEIRTNVATFLSKTIGSYVELKKLPLIGQNQEDKTIQEFLDHLFSLIPTTVSKCWTKFGNYFQFWAEIVQYPLVMQYALRKEMIKHFLDYFLDKKSPLQIYADKKHQIGGKYANPNFAMLLKTVSILTKECMKLGYELSNDDYKVLLHYEFLEKLISENNDQVTVNFIKQICTNNIHASEKVAIILTKGLKKSAFTGVQPYIDIIHQYVLIEDEYQMLRIYWTLGKPTLFISTFHKHINAFHSYNLDERIYHYNSTIGMDSIDSLIDPIFQLKRRAQNFVTLSLRGLLRMCKASDVIFRYVASLPGPTYSYGKFYDFFENFLHNYLEEASKSYSLHYSSINRVEVGTQTRELYDHFMEKVKKLKETENDKMEVEAAENVKPQPKQQVKEEPKVEQQKEGKVEQIPKEQQSQKKAVKSDGEVQEVDKDLQRVEEAREVDQDETSSMKSNKSNKSKPRSWYESNGHNASSEASSVHIDPKAEKIVRRVAVIKNAYMPVEFNYIEKSTVKKDGLSITYHESELTELLLKPTGTGNKSFSISHKHHVKHKLEEEAWENKRVRIVKGLFVKNESKEHLRFKTNQGTQQIRFSDAVWVWADQIERVWPGEWSSEFPKWTLYPFEPNKKDNKDKTNEMEVEEEEKSA